MNHSKMNSFFQYKTSATICEVEPPCFIKFSASSASPRTGMAPNLLRTTQDAVGTYRMPHGPAFRHR